MSRLALFLNVGFSNISRKNQKCGLYTLSSLVFLMSVFFLPCPVDAIQINAREAIVMDYHTGVVLYKKNPDKLMPPASMSKIMTLYLLFQRIEMGSLSFDDTFLVSENAWRKGGEKSGSSTMFLKPGKRVRVEDLIRGIVVQSGNDACIVVAEAISGSEEAFAETMTQKARELGMKNSTFQNSTGWPHKEHLTTARDLAILITRVIRDFPQHYHYFLEREFIYNNIRQYNRNPLLASYYGADGLKTGYTEDAGYGLAASAERAGQRLVLVVNGLSTKKERKLEPSRLFDWGFREFNNYKLFKSDEEVEKAPVWLGKRSSVSLIIKDRVILTIPRSDRREMKVTVKYLGPIPAPIRKGDIVASLMIEVPKEEPISFPLVAGNDIAQLGIIGRFKETIRYLLWGN